MLNIKVFPIHESPGNILHRANLLMKLGLSRVFSAKGFNVTPEHWAILSILWERDGLKQTDLAKLGFKDRPNTTRILDRLERNGFVRRIQDPNDRRSYKIYLTKKGREAHPQLMPLVIDFLQKAFGGLSQRDLNEFKRINNNIIKNLENFDVWTGE